MQLTEEQAVSILVGSGMDATIAETTVAQSGYTFATRTATAATVGFGTAIKNATAGLWAFLTTNPIGWFMMIAAAVAAVAAAVDYLVVTFEESAEAASKAKEAYENSVSELESIGSELESVKKQIADLKAQGQLSLTDKATLAELEAQNKQLEYQYAIQEKLVQQQKEAAAKSAAELFENTELGVRLNTDAL